MPRKSETFTINIEGDELIIKQEVMPAKALMNALALGFTELAYILGDWDFEVKFVSDYSLRIKFPRIFEYVREKQQDLETSLVKLTETMVKHYSWLKEDFDAILKTSARAVNVLDLNELRSKSSGVSISSVLVPNAAAVKRYGGAVQVLKVDGRVSAHLYALASIGFLVYSSVLSSNAGVYVFTPYVEGLLGAKVFSLRELGDNAYVGGNLSQRALAVKFSALSEFHHSVELLSIKIEGGGPNSAKQVRSFSRIPAVLFERMSRLRSDEDTSVYLRIISTYKAYDSEREELLSYLYDMLTFSDKSEIYENLYNHLRTLYKVAKEGGTRWKRSGDMVFNMVRCWIKILEGESQGCQSTTTSSANGRHTST